MGGRKTTCVALRGQKGVRDTSTCCQRKADTYCLLSRASEDKRRFSPRCNSKRKRLQSKPRKRRRGQRQKVWMQENKKVQQRSSGHRMPHCWSRQDQQPPRCFPARWRTS